MQQELTNQMEEVKLNLGWNKMHKEKRIVRYFSLINQGLIMPVVKPIFQVIKVTCIGVVG